MKIQLPELDVISCNGSWTGLILKKHLTFDEARFIAALGVNMDLLLDDWWARSIDEEDDIKDEIDDFTNDVERLLTSVILARMMTSEVHFVEGTKYNTYQSQKI